ncbi:response regulator [uncultured Desulfosarcina sp.]|uniref:hybrid sensor histidine kinase/response regulator n=1 Tax=uncultured Desulfosarcina sp. TaxID=218289 RepID=UPI0029C62887|nr:response regulator [uncultured Desulfosarcina sp.]
MSISPIILIVDDELRMCASLEALLKSNEYEISTANCGRAALVLLNNLVFDLAILDVHLSDLTGHAILNHIRSHCPDTPVIVITGDADLDSALSALRSGAYDYLRKPFEFDELLKTVENALAQRALKREKETLDRELNLSEEKYRYLVQNSPDIIYTLDTDGNFTFLSSAVEHLLGFTPDDLIGKHYSTIVCEEDRKKANWHVNERRRKNRATSGLELRLKLTGQVLRHTRKADFLTVELKSMGIYDPSMPDGKDRHVGTHGVIRDISQRKRLQAQLQNAERMDSLGTLAGGIAHDFNNLLMGIQGRSSLMSMDLDESHPHVEHLSAIHEYIRSASELTNQLLGFARGGKYEVKPTDINELILKTARMFGRTKKEVSIHTQFKNKPIVVESDQRQLEQVLINLYVNAWQAMPDGGELYLGTKIVALDSDFCAPYQLEPGHYAHVSVTDTGIGMGRKTLRRIFDPFFTTKEKAKGTGLGLASAYGIIKNHDGIITVYSEEGHGATFNIYLPMSDKMAVPDLPTDRKIARGSGTVLLVDDEDMILEVGQALLERLGYRVVAVNSGEAAVEAVQRMGSKIDLVLLDMIMPGMSGGEAFDRIREIRPQMRVILSSGYTIDGQARLIMQRGCNGFIQKPFNAAEISQRLRQLLDSDEWSG